MHIAIDISALSSGHTVRGVGSYTEQLISALEKYQSNITYTKIDMRNAVPENIDILHYTFLDLFKRTLKVSDKYRTIVTIHDVIPLVFPRQFPAGIRGNVNLFFLKRALNNVDAVITDSHNSKNDIVRFLSVPSSKITVIYLAGGEHFRRLSKRELLDLDLQKKYRLSERYLLYVGDVNWNKNLGGLIEGFSKLRKDDISLVMVGKALTDMKTLETKQLIEQIHNLGLEKRIVRLGFVPVDDLVGMYNEAVGYIQPSYYEGFGFPVLEAMQCGIPVISSKTSSLAEISGDAVIPIDPGHPDDIARGIEKLTNLTTNQREEIIKKGLEQAGKFSWKNVARETAAVYRRVYDHS
ncbi:MAG: glycosyltransferase family 4 protein [Candidatus Roizmanbacteria bacterium]|nr:glycosyltransferase family 4 protein [Candidatus Roizmanbacteria bacterium]